jgi:Baseplate J-like protein
VKYFCCDDRRRNAVKQHSVINGIDFLEVSDDPLGPLERRQRVLFVHFLKEITAGSIEAGQVRIEGGERIRNIKVLSVIGGSLGSPPSASSPPADDERVLEIEVSEAGDFSTYTLRLVKDPEKPELGPPDDVDQLLSAVDFSFKVACPSDFDCQTPNVCPPVVRRAPEIDYLAKDYASFRRLMLDRMAALMPQWTERNASDLGIALVEILAYVGDHLSYQQDAVATEAYLGTARRRVSVKRHVRLIDYTMGEGATARAWIRVVAATGTSHMKLLRKSGDFITKIVTRVPDAPSFLTSSSSAYHKVLTDAPEVFELVNEITLFERHNVMPFYTWGSLGCCLPKGATRATLRGVFQDLADNVKNGELVVLIFAEVRGPQTGAAGDADPTHRHAVRLTKVTVTEDRLGGRFNDPPDDGAVPVTEIEWDAADALPFPFCVSSGPDPTVFEDVSVAWGNIVLADFGSTEVHEELAQVPESDPALVRVGEPGGDRCDAQPAESPAPRFRPRLRKSPVTHVANYRLGEMSASAASVMRSDSTGSVPVVSLKELSGEGAEWSPKPDLLASGPDKKEFVVEVESDQTAYLRFGDDRFGARPVRGLRLEATYRVGNGSAGNVGANTLVHLISDQPEVAGGVVQRVSNPLPARGGTDPESIEEVRQRAPSAFRTEQRRAVTPEDYAEKAQACRSDIQRAAGTFRWTGSWRTVFVTADRLGGADVDLTFRKELTRCLERYRLAGHDLDVDAPVFVPLEMDMTVCVKPDYFLSDVHRGLLDLFNNRVARDGRKGLFHPDRFTFGQRVYLSPFYSAAQSVAGVDRVEITKFQRVDKPGITGISTGTLQLARLEIARLDNDPNFRERGVFSLTVQGGR